MQKLPDFVPALSHHLKPLLRDSSQFTGMRFHPPVNGGIPLDRAVESQQFRLHRHAVLRTTRWFPISLMLPSQGFCVQAPGFVSHLRDATFSEKLPSSI
jgi:hypothetical protein